jgi:hypothetical protein
MEVVTKPTIVTKQPANLHFFSRFPLEIQLRVYRELSYIPRDIKINFSCVYPDGWQSLHIPFDEKPWCDTFTCFDPVPAAFQLCRASRHEAIKIYNKAFKAIKNPTATVPFDVEPADRYVWVNFEVDILTMSINALDHALDIEVAELRNLILIDCEIYEDYLFDYRKMFAPLMNVLTLDIVTPKSLRTWESDLDRIWGIF